MALMLGKLNDALLAAGASPEQAREAAEEVAAFDQRLNGVEARLTLLTWMIGFNLILTAAVLGKLLTVP